MLLKSATKSLCPECLEVIEARVAEEGGKVFMEKRCPSHGNFRVMIERDAAFYKALYNQEYITCRPPFANLSISVTHKCNLNCPVCYISPLNRPDTDIGELRERIRNFQGKMIWLTGGEPTLRDDLAEIIEFVRMNRKIPVLITNGVRLAEAGYAEKLKRAGLSWAHFSFNGFSNRIYRQMNGRPLYTMKLKALRNLKRVGIDTALSFLYVKGVNEGELKKVFCFCLRNHSFIRQLRIRPMTKNGRYLTDNTVFLSDLAKELGESIGIDKMKVLELALDAKGYDKSAYRADPMPCHIEFNTEFFLKECVAGCGLIDFKAKIKIIRWLMRHFGAVNTAKILWESFFNAHGRFGLSVKLRSWADKERIDLGEMQHCLSGYSLETGSGTLPFCQAIITNERYSHI